MTKANNRLLRDNKRLTRENVIYARKVRNYRRQIHDMYERFAEVEQSLKAEIARLTVMLPVLH